MSRKWVKLWCDDGGLEPLGYYTRACAAMLLKRTDEQGRHRLGGRTPAQAIAYKFGGSQSDRVRLAADIEILIREGYCHIDGDYLCISNFQRWQSDAKTAARPKADQAQTSARPSSDLAETSLRPEPDPSETSDRHSSKLLKTLKSASLDKIRIEEIREEKIEQKETPEGPPVANAPVSKSVLEVFEFWKSEMGSNGNLKLDRKRKTRIQDSLRAYGLDDCKAAIRGCAKSAWHMGRDPKTEGRRHNEIDLIFRDAAHTERFIELDRKAPGPSPMFQKLELQRMAKEATANGQEAFAKFCESLARKCDSEWVAHKLPTPPSGPQSVTTNGYGIGGGYGRRGLSQRAGDSMPQTIGTSDQGPLEFSGLFGGVA